MLYLKFVARELISPLNYLMAFMIGMVLNHFQGEGLFASFAPFLVPILVQSISKASVKYKNRGQALLVRLPMEKKDPAFVIDRNGKIVASEGNTRKFFADHEISRLQDLFEDNQELFDRIQSFSCADDVYNEELYSSRAHKHYEVYIKADVMSNYLLVWLEEVTVRTEFVDDQ